MPGSYSISVNANDVEYRPFVLRQGDIQLDDALITHDANDAPQERDIEIPLAEVLVTTETNLFATDNKADAASTGAEERANPEDMMELFAPDASVLEMTTAISQTPGNASGSGFKPAIAQSNFLPPLEEAGNV